MTPRLFTVLEFQCVDPRLQPGWRKWGMQHAFSKSLQVLPLSTVAGVVPPFVKDFAGVVDGIVLTSHFQHQDGRQCAGMEMAHALRRGYDVNLHPETRAFLNDNIVPGNGRENLANGLATLLRMDIDKPVLLVAYNHLTGIAHPMAYRPEHGSVVWGPADHEFESEVSDQYLEPWALRLVGMNRRHAWRTARQAQKEGFRNGGRFLEIIVNAFFASPDTIPAVTDIINLSSKLGSFCNVTFDAAHPEFMIPELLFVLDHGVPGVSNIRFLGNADQVKAMWSLFETHAGLRIAREKFTITNIVTY